MHRLCRFSAANALLLASLAATAEPIPVRYPQGSAHGFLVLKDVQGKTLAHGEVIQTIHGRRLVSRLVFRFRDGSIDDDITTYTQDGIFRLLTDHHVQKGPSFPKPVDTLVDAGADTVTSRTSGSDGKEKSDVQHLDMSPDVSNGMVLTLIGNIPFKTPQTRLAYIASGTDKSRLVHLVITPAGLENILIAGVQRKMMHFLIKVQLGGVAGVIAPIVGKQPDDVQVWVLGGKAPVIVAEQGQLYLGGPVWRIEIESPTLPEKQRP